MVQVASPVAKTEAKTNAVPLSAKLNQGRFGLAQSARNFFYVKPTVGTTPEQVVVPIYWTNVAAQLRKGDHIEILTADGGWWAELLVLFANATEARVIILKKVQLMTIPAEQFEVATHQVKWLNETQLWAVLRKADAQVIKDGCAEAQDAIAWMRGNCAVAA